MLRKYDYETSDWKISVFGGSALASFTIHYRGKIRDLEFDIHSRVTAFLVKRESGWKLAHEHWSRFPDYKRVDLKDTPRERIRKPKLSLNLPPMDVFERLLDYFETPRFGGIEFSDIKKTPPSHIEGKWFIVHQWLNQGGNFKIDITANNDESKVKVNVNAWRVNILVLFFFFVGLFFFIFATPVWIMWLMFFCCAIVPFVIGQWRTGNILREINELFSNIPETTETLEKDYEKITVKDEKENMKETTETLEGLNVNIPAKDVFNQLVDYFGAAPFLLKQKVPFSHIEGRWACGPFKIDIVPRNGKSQLKFNFSCLYMNLVALFFIIVFFIRLLMKPTSYPYGLTIAIGSLIMSRWMKQNVIKGLKKLINYPQQI